MVFKEAVSLAVEGGKYVCGTVKEELENYLVGQETIQKAVDYVREKHPEWTEERLNQYAFGGSDGQYFLHAKECLEKLGYDTSTLPVVEVPEFFPGAAGVIVAGAMGASILYMKAKDRLYKSKGLEDKL